MAAGTIVVIRNKVHGAIAPLAIGKGLRTKINANIGTSKDRADRVDELEKVRICVEAGADTIMDLSTGGDIQAIRRAIVAASPLVIGTVPIYQAAARVLAQGKANLQAPWLGFTGFFVSSIILTLLVFIGAGFSAALEPPKPLA